MNDVFDDMKQILCTDTGTGIVNEELSSYGTETCDQIKEKLVTQLNESDTMGKLSRDTKNKIISLNNGIVDSVCGADGKPDPAKAKIIGSDIKGMFC
jgi:hypothetical protein